MLESSSSSSPQWLNKYADCIDAQISELFGGSDSTLFRAATDSLARGKRIRAILALLWCEAISGNYESAIPVAVAYELAHASALVQDDIIDHSEMRRGERSIVNKYGLSEAILASNMLLSFVPGKLSQYASSPAPTLQRLFELLGESYGATVWGEFLDLEMSRKEKVTEKEYEQMIRAKTGALVAASSASGAIVGGALAKEPSSVDIAFKFGELIGMAYQVHDDLLDIVGDERELGKPTFADIGSGKKNIVLLHSLQSSSEPDQEFLASLLRRRSTITLPEMERAKDLFVSNGSIKYARKMALRYSDEAQKLISSLDEMGSSVGSKLIEISDYLSNRKF